MQETIFFFLKILFHDFFQKIFKLQSWCTHLSHQQGWCLQVLEILDPPLFSIAQETRKYCTLY